MRSKALAIDHFILKTTKPALSWSVIPAVAFTAHRADHAVGLELSLVAVAAVLATSVRVQH